MFLLEGCTMQHTFVLGYDIGFSIKDSMLYADCSGIFSETDAKQLKVNIFCMLHNDLVYFIRGNEVVSKQSTRVWISKLLRYYHQLIYDVYNQSYILLHASCIEYNGKTIAIAGSSKSGKSTCLYNLMREGASFITDDIVLIDTENNLAIPSPQTLTKLRFKVENSVEVNDTGDKSKIYLYSFSANGYKKQTVPQKLDKIIYIKYANHDNIIVLNKMEAINKLTENVFNTSMIKMDKMINIVSNVRENTYCQYRGDVELIKYLIDK